MFAPVEHISSVSVSCSVCALATAAIFASSKDSHASDSVCSYICVSDCASVCVYEAMHVHVVFMLVFAAVSGVGGH